MTDPATSAVTDPGQIIGRTLDVADEVLAAARDQALTRSIRGRLLGSYQSVQHTLADHWVAIEAVRAAAGSPAHADVELATAVGATRALSALCDDAVRLRGGRGYLVEDVAARGRLEAMRLERELGPVDHRLERLGRPGRPSLQRPGSHTAEVAAVLAPVWDDRRALAADRDGRLHDPRVHRAVAARGWLGVFVAHARLNPQLEPAEAFAIAEELTIAGIPIHALNTTAMVSALVRDHGSEHLRTVVLPALLDGREICALGYTEPDAGSDLAAVTTTATRQGGGWRLSGTKLFCTLADVADHVLVLARSDAGSERHRGLTLFLVPTDGAGMRVRMLPTHGGESTCELHLEGVEVGDEQILGAVDGGWAVAMSAMRYERNASPWCDGLRLLGLADELGRETVDGRLLSADPDWSRTLGSLFVDLVLGRGLVDALLTDAPALGPCAPSAVKLYTTEALVASAGAVTSRVPAVVQGAPAAVRIDTLWRRSVALTIAGGASEVQRDVIATQGLGLPRG